MSTTVYSVVNDTGRVIGVVLRGDPTDAEPLGAPVDLTGEVIECHMRNKDTGDVIEITGLTGSDAGEVSTPFAADDLVAGTWTLEWQVVDGLTFPSAARDRIVHVIRPEVS